MPVRVNTKISDEANDWLDQQAEKMALTKSALINIAIENYRKEVEVMHLLPQLMALKEELEEKGTKL